MNLKLINEKNYLIIAVAKWHGRFYYSACSVVNTYVVFIWVYWILMAYASSTAYLLTRLPHAGLYNYNGTQVEPFQMRWFNCGWINRA